MTTLTPTASSARWQAGCARRPACRRSWRSASRPASSTTCWIARSSASRRPRGDRPQVDCCASERGSVPADEVDDDPGGVAGGLDGVEREAGTLVEAQAILDAALMEEPVEVPLVRRLVVALAVLEGDVQDATLA